MYQVKHMKPQFSAVLATCTLVLAACQGQDQPVASTAGAHAGAEHPAEHGSAHGIAWHKGDVAAAFAMAAEQNKPLFLYWGAVWCPPCVQIKSTIFNQREFIDRTRLFLPVYLDGDTEQAQKWGEKFGVLGYPTVIVFNPSGEEITRIPGGINIDQYASVLDTALASMTPVPRILERVLADPGHTLEQNECRLLAYYSWGQDNQRALAQHDKLEAFDAMWRACPAGMVAERSRLFSERLAEALRAQGDGENPVPMSAEDKRAAYQQVLSILGDRTLQMANISLVVYSAAETLSGLTAAGTPQREELEAKWLQALAELEADASLSKTEHVLITLARVDIERADNPEAELPQTLLDEARAKAAWADANSDAHERQTVMYYTYVVLRQAGLLDDARQLVTAELDKAQSPYYFMSLLAGLAEKEGKTEEAVAWLRRAYEESNGPATRFQWGTNYVVGLLELTPEDAEGIEKAASGLLDELGKVNGAFYNRNSKRLAQLDKALREWNGDGSHQPTLMRIRAQVQGLCAGLPEGDESRSTCEGFLADA